LAVVREYIVREIGKIKVIVKVMINICH
jgi:hypothetical protein